MAIWIRATCPGFEGCGKKFLEDYFNIKFDREQ